VQTLCGDTGKEMITIAVTAKNSGEVSLYVCGWVHVCMGGIQHGLRLSCTTFVERETVDCEQLESRL